MSRRLVPIGLVALGMMGSVSDVLAQSVEARHWQGATAMTRQPEHLVATTMAEWKSLWSRTGMAPPEAFEAGRMNAVGIFLGRRAGEGFAVNILSTTRRRDRIVVVFEERMPPDIMLAQRVNPAPASRGAGGPAFAGAAGFASPGAVATVAPPPMASPRPVGQPTSPWAIVLINRTDLPISVEQRMFR
jgi:hypothetical protein